MVTVIRRTELHEAERKQYNTTQTTISNTHTAHLITFSFFSSALPFFPLPQHPSPLSSPLQLISIFFFFPFSIPEFLPSQLTIFSFPPRFLYF